MQVSLALWKLADVASNTFLEIILDSEQNETIDGCR